MIIPIRLNTSFRSVRALYIDVFDKKRLVYLTPDSPNEMTHFDHDAIYILGGIYDDENKEPLTYEKAFHSTSSRALAFHEVYNILLTLKHTNNDWIKAFRYVPKRKIASPVEEGEEEEDNEVE